MTGEAPCYIEGWVPTPAPITAAPVREYLHALNPMPFHVASVSCTHGTVAVEVANPQCGLLRNVPRLFPCCWSQRRFAARVHQDMVAWWEMLLKYWQEAELAVIPTRRCAGENWSLQSTRNVRTGSRGTRMGTPAARCPVDSAEELVVEPSPARTELPTAVAQSFCKTTRRAAMVSSLRVSSQVSNPASTTWASLAFTDHPEESLIEVISFGLLQGR